MPSTPTTTKFDPIFEKHRGRVPLAFLRSLAAKESGFDPNKVSTTGARGLFQVTGVVLTDYNRRHKTAYTRDDLFDPNVSAAMGADLLQQIINAYAKHPSPNLKEDWKNNEFVKLLTMGWNAGYSNGGGVGKVASYLENKGQPVTHDNVVANAPAAGAVAKLALSAPQLWQRGVAALYRAQPDWPGTGAAGGAALIMLGLFLLGLHFMR